MTEGLSSTQGLPSPELERLYRIWWNGAPAACNDLLAEAAQVPRYEKQLSLLPGWLRWLEKSDLVPAVGGFAVQLWYYAQLDHIGRTGAPRVTQSLFSAMLQVEKHHADWLAARRKG